MKKYFFIYINIFLFLYLKIFLKIFKIIKNENFKNIFLLVYYL